MLTHVRPPHDATPTVWVAFHRRAARAYAHAAKVDLGHRHEANHWAGAEIRHAREIEHRLGIGSDVSESAEAHGVEHLDPQADQES